MNPGIAVAVDIGAAVLAAVGIIQLCVWVALSRHKDDDRYDIWWAVLFGLLPPEINSGRMYAGAGAGPLLSAAAAWNVTAAHLASAAAAMQTELSALSSAWRGASAQAMSSSAARYVSWLTATASAAEHTATQAGLAVAAYETAFAAIVPPSAVAANRAQLFALIATNVLGQNTAAIAANEAMYSEMWAQDAAAMYAYAFSSASVRNSLQPFTAAPQTASPAGIAAPAAAQSSTGSAQSILSVLENLNSMFSFMNNNNAVFGPNANIWNTIFTGGFNPLQVIQLAAQLGTLAAVEDVDHELAAGAVAAADHAGTTLPAMISAPPAPAVTAQTGGAARLGGLSAPSWAAKPAAAPPAVRVSYTPAPEEPLPMMPLPFGGAAAAPKAKERVKYGITPKVMPRPPSGG